MASFHFNEIELKHERDPELLLCDSIPIFESILTLVSLPNLDSFLESTLIPVPIDFEIELLILKSHISLMEKKCEFQFFDLNSTLEQKLTLERKVDFFELVLVTEPIILEPKSSIS